MIRVVVYLVIVGFLALGAVWLADRPGEVVITWEGRHFDTSVMVLTMAVPAIAVAAVMLWSAIRAIIRSPGLIARYIDTRRGVRGYRAVSQGLVAVGSGDARAARKFADEAKRIAPHEPLTLLLSAQTAQLSGDRGAGGIDLPDGGPRRHQASRFARPVHRGAPPRRSGRGAALCRGGGEARLDSAMGRAGGAGVPLCRRRLVGGVGAARAQPQGRAGRQGRLPAPARRAADRAGTGAGGRSASAGKRGQYAIATVPRHWCWRR